MNTISLPQLPWHGTKKLNFTLPDTWQVEFYHMAGWNRPALKPAEIKAAIATPIGIPPLRKLARGKNEVAIIFDDMTRVTRATEIVPAVLEELTEAGIQDSKIRFICALGCHGAHNRLDFEKKLGREIVARFPVYNHNPFGRCTYVGTTHTYKTKVSINEEVMKCDLKIAIGLVTPHPASGFGGGGKIIMPGIASFETIEHNHRATMEYMIKQQNTSSIGMGIFDNNPMRFDIEEAATLTGLDVMINCIVNQQGETAAIFCGALIPAYTSAVREAKSHYLTPDAQGEGIVIANTFAKASEGIAVGLGTAFRATPPQGGDIILIANAPDGQVTHYLMGPFGRETAGALGFRVKVPQNVNRVCIFSEYPDVTGRDYIEESDKVFFTNTWDEVLEIFTGPGVRSEKVAVYPSADIQYSRQG